MSKATPPRPNANRVSLSPLTPEQAISGMFKIKPADVKRIISVKARRLFMGFPFNSILVT